MAHLLLGSVNSISVLCVSDTHCSIHECVRVSEILASRSIQIQLIVVSGDIADIKEVDFGNMGLSRPLPLNFDRYRQEFCK